MPLESLECIINHQRCVPEMPHPRVLVLNDCSGVLSCVVYRSPAGLMPPLMSLPEEVGDAVVSPRQRQFK